MDEDDDEPLTEEEIHEEWIEELKFAIDVIAEARLMQLADGRSSRQFWAWLRKIVSLRADTIALEEAIEAGELN